MNVETLRAYCLSLPHATENVQWGDDLVFKVGGKMFTVASLEPEHGYLMSVKCTPEKFAELVEMEDIDPAPYVARYPWVALKRYDALPAAELKALIRASYDLVVAALPKKAREALDQTVTKKKKVRPKK